MQQVVGGVGGGSASAAAAAVTNVIRSGRAVAQAAAAAAQAAGDAVGTAGSAGTAVDPRLLASAAHLSASASLTASKCGIHIHITRIYYIYGIKSGLQLGFCLAWPGLAHICLCRVATKRVRASR